MSAKHLWALDIPGCGQAGGCDWAANGPYSKFLGIPVAFIGVAFFAAMLCGLLVAGRGPVDPRLKWLARLGALASLGFITLMVVHSRLCPWCAFTHLGNLIFWIMLEIIASARASATTRSWRQPGIIAGVGLAVIAGMLVIDHRAAVEREAENYRKGMESVEKIGQDSASATISRDTTAHVGTPSSTPAESPSKAGSPGSVVPKAVAKAPSRFTGRYTEGNPDAPVRIVMFHDYECELCAEVEGQISRLLQTRSDIAVSVKQWPFDSDCNRFILGKNMHPGACRAARAAEAAGMLGGNAAFWSLHNWLVSGGGNPSQDQLIAQVDHLGLDRGKFLEAMNSPTVDSLVRADIEEGMALGLTFTPLLFVNGYRVDGWQNAAVLPAAIERAAQVARTQPRRNDRPDLAVDLQFHQWQAMPASILPLRANEQTRGPVDAATTIIVYGDLTCPFHATAYADFDRILKKYPKVRYVFRDFPLDSTCNDLVKQQINPKACQASRWAIAARTIGGDPAYWKAHDWVVRHRDNPAGLTVDRLAKAIGLDVAALQKASETPQAYKVVEENLALAKRIAVNSSPTIFVNGKQVAGWRTPGLLDRVVAAAVSAEKL
jgi:protein-disulfide isomerase/uncharacterized membrane protein